MSKQLRTQRFSGQRMVVVPRPILRKAQVHPLLEDLVVTDAGFFPKADGHSVTRPTGATTELLMVCVAGTGLVRMESTSTRLEPGDVVWLPAGKFHHYEADLENPWTLLWVHFQGKDMENLSKLVFGNDAKRGFTHIAREQIHELQLDQIHRVLEKGYALLNMVEAAAAFRLSLTILARLRYHEATLGSTQACVMASIDKLRLHWNEFHRLEELAAMAGISVSHYSKVFKNVTGFSPIDFVIRQRMNQAARLLATSEKPVGVIGQEVGYEDSYYFARMFRRIMGCSPREYRQQNGFTRS